MTRTWDIFCSVVDNFGDIGVCWRLARQLSSEVGHTVRLWVDDLASFQRICRDVDPALESQHVGAVEVRHWTSPLADVRPADIVVEGFGVRLPENYIAAMAERDPPPAWINLEHLSAEEWVDGCHGLPSPHPSLPLVKYFFFPGFTAATGGLLIERELVKTRDAFQSDAQAVTRFWHALEIAPGDERALHASLFCYENAALPALVAAWSSGAAPVICVVPAGAALNQLSSIVGRSIEPGVRMVRENLTIAAIPFLDVDAYDRLLWACDINFVRGEDSFVRTQLAARPLAWQAYVQEGDAHMAKHAAFLDRYLSGLDAATAAGVRGIQEAWNRQSPEIGPCWKTFMGVRDRATVHARSWADRLAQGGSLAAKLAEFTRNRLE
jgi:uncharacterized repeat protein (TIGR03837 family)